MNHTREYLTSIGLDPETISVSGWDWEGYRAFQTDSQGQLIKLDGLPVTDFRPWPEEFNHTWFLFAILADEYA